MHHVISCMKCGRTCDVMMQTIDAEAEHSVHSLEGGINKLPVRIVVDDGIGIVVLQEGDGYQPPSEEDPRREIIEHNIGDTLSAYIVYTSAVQQHYRRADQTFEVFFGVGMLTPEAG